jgi:type IV pilus assembly protein PilB
MGDVKPGAITGPEETPVLPYDAELEKYFPIIRGSPAVSLKDTSRFSPQMINYYAQRGALPYKLDFAQGEIIFALDNTRFDEFVNAQDFRIQFDEVFSLMSPELRRLAADDKKVKLIYFEPSLFERMTQYVANPGLIDIYRSQRKQEEDTIRGVINDKETEAFVDNLFNRAIKERASDIHFESCSGLEHRIRFRVDGKLRESPNILSSDMYKALVIVLKNRCGSGLRIEEKRRPQDGQLSHTSGEVNDDGSARVYDLRVAFRPVVGGAENVTLRIAQRGIFRTLDNLGLSDYDHERINQACAEPNGIILVTGPTGSGKTTTLYGMLHSINDPTRKIVTIEDPVEVQMKGLQQTQVHNQIGVDFPSFLRGALRTDPDVIFVGEIRDKETADIAIEAAMTGHLVLSSLHTNNAPGAVNRLTNMNISRADLAMNLRGVMAQTLVPVFEEKLRQRIASETLTEEDKKHIQFVSGDQALNSLAGRIIYPAGSMYFCEGDESTFKGREALTEFWLLDEQSQDAICNSSAGVSLLTNAAEQSGMRPMFISGVEKVANGITSLEAVLDAVGKSVFRRKSDILEKYIKP